MTGNSVVMVNDRSSPFFTFFFHDLSVRGIEDYGGRQLIRGEETGFLENRSRWFGGASDEIVRCIRSCWQGAVEGVGVAGLGCLDNWKWLNSCRGYIGSGGMSGRDIDYVCRDEN